MAATLLAQAESAVAALQREAAASPGAPMTDSCEALSDFCLILERVFNHSARSKSVLSEKRDVWAFLSAALEKSASFPLIKRIQSSTANRTNLGKARSFVRVCLLNQSLGTVLQVRFFHTLAH